MLIASNNNFTYSYNQNEKIPITVVVASSASLPFDRLIFGYKLCMLDVVVARENYSYYIGVTESHFSTFLASTYIPETRYSDSRNRQTTCHVPVKSSNCLLLTIIYSNFLYSFDIIIINNI